MGSRRVNRPWAVGLLALMAAIALLVAFVGGGRSGSSNGSGDNDSAAPLSSGGHTVTGAVKGAQAALTGGGELRAGSTNVLALGDSARARLVGRAVTARNVQVSSVLRNGEFWIGGNGNRMLVDAHGAKARVGEILSFHGTIVRNARPVAGSTVRVVASGLRGR